MSNKDSIMKLKVLRCDECRKLYVPPRYHCGECGNSEFSEVQLNGNGEIYSYTLIRVPFEEFSQEAPYVFAEFKLDEGLVVPGRITNEGEKEVKIGSRVSFEEWKQGVYWFKLT